MKKELYDTYNKTEKLKVEQNLYRAILSYAVTDRFNMLPYYIFVLFL